MEQQDKTVFRPDPVQSLCQACPRKSVLLFVCLLLPLLAGHNLVCNFCKLQRKRESCPKMTTVCNLQQRCYSARGFYGSAHILSQQGCVSKNACGTVEMVPYKGGQISLNYTCCCRDLCNLPPKPDNMLKMLLGATLSPSEENLTADSLTDDCQDETPQL